VLAYFGYPTAHEDDARRAVQAGLGITEAMQKISKRVEKEHGIPVEVRVGIHTGLVVVGDMDQTDTLESKAIVGQTPNLAARLQTAAEPNTVLVSGDTYKLIRGYFESVDLGTHELKGITQAVQIYRIDHASTARSRLDAALGQLTPFAGRESEMETLREKWHRAQEGKGQIVLLGGEAGVGKSRLLLSLKEHISHDPESWLTEMRSSPYHHSSSFYPVIDLLERIVLRFEKDDSPEEKLTKIEGFIAQYGMDAAEAVPLIASLLSVPLGTKYAPLAITPQRQKQRTIDTLITILLHRAKLQQILFVLEDLHWSDPSTFELIDQLIERCDNEKILVLFTYRPSFTPHWKPRTNMTTIDLAGLPIKNAGEIIRRVADNKELPKEAVDYIVEKTDGIPLFLEELTKSMIESGMLVDKGDSYELSAPLHTLGVPTTIQDSLTARLDRLPQAKQVAQLASTVGREFSYDILDSIPGNHRENLRGQLDTLVEAGILFQYGTAPNPVYSFKHALIQDSAYSSLLKTSRKDYHKLIAESIEKNSPGLIETQPELLAQHYTKALITDKAIQYWLAAGLRALQRSANAESISHLKQGLELAATITEDATRNAFELQLHSMIGPALIATRGFGDAEVGETYQKAGELSKKLGDGPHLFIPMWGQWVYNLVRDELGKARALSLEMKRLGSESKNTAMLVEAHWTLGNTEFWAGNFQTTFDELTKAIEIYNPEQHHINAYMYGQDPGVAAHCYRSYTYWYLGYPDKALEEHKSAVELAESLRHPFSIGWAYAFGFMVRMFSGDHQSAKEWAEKTIAFCTEQAYPFWLIAALTVNGWATAMLGDPKTGLAMLEQGLGGWDMIGSIIVRPMFMGLYAEALGLDGQIDKALSVVGDALVIAQEHGEIASEIDLYRIRGELLASQGKKDEAEKAIRYGLELAVRHESPSRQLQAATSLVKLLKGTPQEADARTILTDSLAWFSEGFETTFIKDARTLSDNS
jgi:predicted ATPase/energy-coupling factor transporter ATP-binding protein EcfA2